MKTLAERIDTEIPYFLEETADPNQDLYCVRDAVFPGFTRIELVYPSEAGDYLVNPFSFS